MSPCENEPTGGRPVWQWNEMQQVGTDYADVAEVARYERRMGQFRNLAAEDAAILDLLELPKGSRILEIGTGTGHFALAAAQAGYRVRALDISPAMLQFAQQRAQAAGVTDVEFCKAGFLTFASDPAEFDAAVSVAVLHHLPDVWKAVALCKIHRALKPGGRFVLRDVVFSSKDRDPRRQFDAVVDAAPPSMRPEFTVHIAKEYSTFDWIMEGLLTRAGFTMEQVVDAQAPLLQYLCRAAERPDD
ncbi:MAG: class I SAM-dependent methyltransferase [Thermoguttaceae bacterium]